MSSRIPSFLLGGINQTFNFVGTRTARTAGYGVVEIGVKMIPVMTCFAVAAASQQESSPQTLEDIVAVPAQPVTERRSSLT